MTTTDTRPVHFITWTHDQDCVQAQATCTAPEGADCRLICPEGCESWSIDHDEGGKPFHRTGHFEDDGTEVRHAMEASDCNVVEFLNIDGSINELSTDASPFVIGTIAIEESWEGDYYSWKRAEPVVQPLPERDPACVERWPDCAVGEYNPACCRFPKSCSCWPREVITEGGAS